MTDRIGRSRPTVPAGRIALLSLAVFLVGSPFAAYVGLAPRIELEWSLSASVSAALYSAYLLGAALAAALILPRAPRGSPSAIRLGTVLVAVAHLALGAMPGPISAALSRVVAGAAYIVVYYAAVQWIAAVTPPAYRGRAIGAVVMAGYAGTSASYLLVAAVLGPDLDWRIGYTLVSIPGLAAVAVAWLALRAAKQPSTSTGHPPADAVAWNLMGGANLTRIVAGYAIHTAELFVARFWIPYALLTVLVPGTTTTSPAQIYLLSGLLFATGVPSPLLGGWLADRFGTGRTAGFVLLGGAVLAALLLMTDRPIPFIGLSLAYCALLPADSAVFTSGVTLFARPEWLGRAQAVQAMTGFVAGAALPALVGVLVQTMNDSVPWKVALATNALIALTGSFFLFRISAPPELHASTS